MKNGQNQRGLIGSGQTEQVVVLDASDSQTGDKIVTVLVDACARRELRGYLVDPAYIGAAFGLAPCFMCVTNDLGQIACCTTSQDVGRCHLLRSASRACSANPPMLPSTTPPR